MTEKNENTGLTKREYIAALALQGMLAGPREFSYPDEEVVTTASGFARQAVHFADFLIAALEEPTP